MVSGLSGGMWTYVLVQLGPAPCPWLEGALRAVAQHGPTVLITDADHHRRAAARVGVSVWEVPHNRSGARSFRSGFWHFSRQRFELLSDFQQETRQPVAHIESDVLLLRAIPFIPALMSGRIWFSLLAPKRGVGSVVLLPTAEASARLAAHFRKFTSAESPPNDMDILGLLYKEEPEVVGVLPTCSPDWATAMGRYPDRLDFVSEVSKYSPAFDGIFDGATVGQYLTGLDPRNSRGVREVGRVPSDHWLDPRAVTWELQGAHLRIRNDEYGSLYTLHIHSKDLRLFSDFRDLVLEMRLRHQGTVRAELVPKALMSAIGESIRRRLSK